ncbi:hypothetical protein ATCC90586_001447 [Pythium insidiosum]|nr:hypothetical protein ATCC90586_001447 [Pythium insidiosum]
MALMGSARVRLLVLLALMALLKSLALLKATSSASTTQPATEISTSLRQSAARDAVTTAMAPPLQSHQPDGLGVGVDDVDADDDDEKDDDLDRASQGNQLAVVATNASANSYDSVLDRTVVHVLEKCCPYVSRYIIGAYPSHLEQEGWVPGLTFHAYRHRRAASLQSATLPLDCWEIRETNESRSHVWHLINTTDALKLDAPGSFCLPKFQRNSSDNSQSSVRYVENHQQTMSFLTQPVFRQFVSSSDHAYPVGWGSDRALAIKEIVLPAHYYWRAMMPHRLLERVWFHVATAPSRRQCRGGEAVEGNLNEGFVMEPVVTLCVAFAPVPQLNPWLDFGEFHPQAKNLSFVSNFEVLARVPIIKQNHTWLQVALRKAMRNDEQFECDAESSEVPWEVDSDVDLKTGDHGQKVPYEVVLGTGKALAFCVHKRPLLLDTGEIQNPTVFVHHLELNTSHIRRRDRISVVYNPSTNALAKRPPPKGVRVVAGGTSF